MPHSPLRDRNEFDPKTELADYEKDHFGECRECHQLIPVNPTTHVLEDHEHKGNLCDGVRVRPHRVIPLSSIPNLTTA